MNVIWRGKDYTFTPRTLFAEPDREGQGAKVTIDGNIYGFDTESVSLPDRYEPQCFQVSSKGGGEDLIYLPPKTKGLEFFLAWFIRKYSYLEMDSHYCFMYGHNLMYDWNQLIKHYPDLLAMSRTGIGLQTEHLIYNETDYQIFLKKGGLFTGSAPHFSLKVRFSKREWFEIMFRDTYSFFTVALSKLCKDLKLSVQKMERADDLGKVDYREMEDCEKKRDFELYAKIDAKGTRLGGEVIRDLHINAHMQRIRVSAPGFAINYLYHMIPEGTAIRNGVNDRSIMQLILDTYAGGRTGGIYHGKVENIAVFDFHSSYPASMVCLPSFSDTMDYIRYPDSENLSQEEFLEIISECHCFARVSGTETDPLYPSIITNKNGKLTPVYGKFENMATTGVEISVGVNSGTLTIDRIHELVLLVEMEPHKVLPFKVFAETLYEEKAAAEKGSVVYIRSKLGLNAGYGKLIESRTETPVNDDVKNIVLPYVEGMKTDFAKVYYKEYIESLSEESTENFTTRYPELVENIINEFGEDLTYATFGTLSLTKLEYGRYAIPAAASLITATSRARLCCGMKILKSIYWDTDSLFNRDYDPLTINEKLAIASKWLPPFITPLKVGEGLGDLDCEIQNASGYLAGTKRYYLENDVKRNCPDNHSSKCRTCENKKCLYKKALHGIPTAPFDKAEEMIQKLATGSNNKYTGKERPTGVKETKDKNEIGRFSSKDYESQFKLDDRLEWEKDQNGWMGKVKSMEGIT